MEVKLKIVDTKENQLMLYGRGGGGTTQHTWFSATPAPLEVRRDFQDDITVNTSI